MRRFITKAAGIMMALTLIVSTDAFAQTRRSTGNGSSTRSSSTTTRGSSTSSSSSSSSSSKKGISTSGSSSQDRRSTTSSGSTRSTGAIRSSGSSTSTATTQQDNRRTTGTTRGTGSSTSSSSTRSGSGTSGTTVRSGSTGTGSTSGTTVRSGSSGSTSGTTVRSSGTTTRSSSSSSGTTASAGSSSQRTSSGTVRSAASNYSRSGLSNGSSQQQPEGGRDGSGGGTVSDNFRDRGANYRYNDDFRMDEGRNIFRVPPRERDFVHYDHLNNFWGDHPHYYGYRINALPPGYRRISHWGIDYYYYGGVYYRPYGSCWVVCRPPYYTSLEAAIDRAVMRAVTFSYYCNTYRTYNAVFDYYNTIAQQNLIIAQQNARLAAQSSAYALNSNRALSAYELANRLGLVQSYAYANSDYFYQDGVFYTISASGMYSTIVPPAGALVTSLPDDYEIIVLNGIEYYMVDNTVYRTTLFDGQPYLEVLGQMYGSMYNQYDIYR